MSGATENKDGSQKAWKHGKTIVAGEVRFTSVSALEKADSSGSSGCLRKYYYHYKMGLKEGPSTATERGNKGHAELAKYLTTGERSHLSSLSLSGLHLLPPPGDDLLVEHDLVADLPDGSSGLAFAKLRVAGIPLVGAIDLAHARPENYGVEDHGALSDEPGVIKLIDHKFPGDMKNAKSPGDLVKTFQMAGYALWAFESFPGTERVRLTHNYFPVQGQPRAPTALVTREQAEQTWKRATAVGVSIRDAARESNPDLIEANTRACRAYGRDCPAKHVCRAASHNSLSALVGGTAADRLLGNLKTPQIHSPPNGEPLDMTTPIAPNSLTARLKAQAAGTAAPVQAAPALMAPVAPVPFVATAPAALAPPAAEVQAELDRLSAAEAAAASTATPPHPLLELIAEIESYKMGFPVLAGAAAKAYIDAQASVGVKLDWSGAALGGSGDLAQYTIEFAEHLPAVLAEVQAYVAKAAADAAAPSAATAAPTQAIADSVATTTPAQTTPAQTTTTTEPLEAPAAKRKPGRPKKVKDAPAPTDQTADASAAPSVTNVTNVIHVVDQTPMQMIDTAVANPDQVYQQTTTTTGASAEVEVEVEVEYSGPGPSRTPQPSGGINVFVDCVVDGIQTISLWPLVENICANMSLDAAQMNSDGNAVVTDFRCADPQGKYGFGKWRGVLAACLRSCPSKGLLPPGNYQLDGAMGEIGGVVAETMRQIARASGGAYVKGAR